MYGHEAWSYEGSEYCGGDFSLAVRICGPCGAYFLSCFYICSVVQKGNRNSKLYLMCGDKSLLKDTLYFASFKIVCTSTSFHHLS